MKDEITLREYLEEKIKHLQEKMILLNAANEKALTLKAEENKQHFENLNGEAGRINKILEATIPREVHERDIKELAGKIEAVNLTSKDFVTRDYLAATLRTPSDDIKSLTSNKDVQTGKNIVIGIVITFLLTLLSIGISIFK